MPFVIFSFSFLGLYTVFLLSKVGRTAPLNTTPLAFGMQLALILFVLFSKIYLPEDPPRNNWQGLDRLLEVGLILGVSGNLVRMYFRLFYRYERLAAMQQKPSNPPTSAD